MICNLVLYFYHLFDDHQVLHSFPTRRSSDLFLAGFVPKNCGDWMTEKERIMDFSVQLGSLNRAVAAVTELKDRKSTRLNSSHSQISYAVFCLKKKKKESIQI